MRKSWHPVLPPARAAKKDNFKQLQQISQFIYQLGEASNLREPSKALSSEEILSKQTKAKIIYLKDCLQRYRQITGGKGRGIAAVQVGIQERIFCFYRKEQKESIEVWINPQITKKAEKLYLYTESCMSCNFFAAPVVRPAWVEVEYLSESGVKKVWNLKDTTKRGKIENRVIQHEIDHLEGIINIEHVNSQELIFQTEKDYRANKFIDFKK